MKFFTPIFLCTCTLLNAQVKQSKETFVLEWPAKEWKLVQKENMGVFTMYNYVHPNESLEQWTERGNTTVYYKQEPAPMDTFMYRIYRQTAMMFPSAKLTLREKDEKAKYPWIIFTIDIPEGISNVQSISEIFYVTLGKTGFYTNQISVKRTQVSAEEVKKWSAFFKKAKVINK